MEKEILIQFTRRFLLQEMTNMGNKLLYESNEFVGLCNSSLWERIEDIDELYSEYKSVQSEYDKFFDKQRNDKELNRNNDSLTEKGF